MLKQERIEKKAIPATRTAAAGTKLQNLSFQSFAHSGTKFEAYIILDLNNCTDFHNRLDL